MDEPTPEPPAPHRIPDRSLALRQLCRKWWMLGILNLGYLKKSLPHSGCKIWAFIVSGGAAVIFGLLTGQLWMSWLVFALGILAIIAYDYWMVKRELTNAQQEQQFSVTAITSFVSPEHDCPTAFHLVVDWKDGPVCPIFAILFLQIKNTTSTMLMINSYTVETEISKGIWETTTPMYFGAEQIIHAPTKESLRKAIKVTLIGQSLNDILTRKNIASHETLHAWVVLDGAKDGCVSSFRLITTDSTGKRSIAVITRPAKAEPGMVSAYAASMATSGTVDVSSLPMCRYRDFAYHAKLSPQERQATLPSSQAPDKEAPPP